MKKTLLGLALLASVLHADPGFFPIGSPGLPAPVLAAADKVLSIWVFGEKPRFRVTPAQVAALIAQMEAGNFAALEQVEVRDPGMLRLILEELKGLPAGSEYLLYPVARSTAFAVDGKLVTARHVFSNGWAPRSFSAAPTADQARQALAAGRGRVRLTDSQGKVLFDTRNEAQKIKRFVFSGHPHEANLLPQRYQELETSSLGQLLDFVRLELTGIDLTPRDLVLAPGAVAPGQRVFTAGFPLRTEGRVEHFKVPDSDGDSLRVSVGKVQPGAPADYAKFLATLMEPVQRGVYEDSIVFTDLDFVPGSSGGPVLNEQGEVVSLASTVRHDPHVSPVARFTVTTSYGPRFSDLKVFFK